MSPLLFLACITPKPVDSDSAEETGQDTADTGETSSSAGPTIFDINNGEVPTGTAVTLDRVVITSPHTYGDEGFFIQDPAGGARSGLYVWSYNGVAEMYATPGKEVSVTGSVADYYGWIELVIDSVDDVVVTGDADIPAPVELGDGVGVNWDEYESVPVTLTGQNIGSISEYGTAYLTESGLGVDNGFVNLDYACRGAFPEITGIIFFQYSEWSLNPREEEDAEAYTAGPQLDATVAELQQGDVCGPVALHDLVVTSPSWLYDGNGYFFAQDPGGGAYSGIVVFVDGAEVSYEVGDVVDVAGEVTEFYGLTEVRVDDEDDIVLDGQAEPTVDVVAAAEADWEPWEGCLVSVGPLDQSCADPAKNYGECATEWGLTLDNLFYDFPWEEGVGYEQVVGLVNYAYSTWQLVPRAAEDVTQE